MPALVKEIRLAYPHRTTPWTDAGAHAPALGLHRPGRGDAARIPSGDHHADPCLRPESLKAYGRVTAVSGVSFEIAAGEIFGLLGPNGAGKTTTVESVVGLIRPDAGEIEICGIDVRQPPAAAREVIGVALQSTGLQDKITPREALDLFGGFHRAPLATGLLLERFGLTDKAGAPTTPSPAGSGSGWRWRWPSSTIRRPCSSTSRPRAWTRRCGASCMTTSASSGPTAARSC